MAKQNRPVGNSNTIPSKLFDAVALEQQTKYYKNGLDYISNDANIITRDDVGNIVLVEDAANNPKLLINAVTEQISTKSVLRVINTRFQYYKFPVQTVTENLDLNLDLELDIDLEAALATVPVPLTPSTYKPSSNEQVVRVSKQSGDLQTIEAQPLDFSNVTQGPTQTYQDSFTITQELVDEGNDLKITGVITTQYNARRNSEIGFFLAVGENGNVNGSNRITATFYPNEVNNNNKVTEPGVYTTNISEQISNESLLDLVGQSIYVLGFAEDQEQNRNHTILADQTFVKFESVV